MWKETGSKGEVSRRNYSISTAAVEVGTLNSRNRLKTAFEPDLLGSAGQACGNASSGTWWFGSHFKVPSVLYLVHSAK